MSEGVVVSTPGGRSFLANLFGLYLTPGESFADIVKRPRFWAPLAAIVALNVAFTAIWMQKVEPGEFMKAQMEESGRWDEIPADRREAILEGQGKMFSVFAWLGALVFAPLFFVITAAVLLLVFRFFYGGEVGFSQLLAITCFTFLALALVQTPLILLVMSLKGDWNVNPQHALQANASLLVAKESVAKPLYALLGSLDLFSFWAIGLLAVGCGIAVRRPASAALWGVVVPWAVVVAVKVLFAAF